MSNANQLSRWGAISKVLDDLSPASRAFFVGDTDNSWHADFVNEFPPDNYGDLRVFSSMFDSTMLATADAQRGDVVFVMPGHSESISADQSVAVDGLRFVGLGWGNNRPTVQYDDTAASVSLDTDNMELENIRLLASVSGITRAVDVAGDGCAIRRCSFQFDETGDDFIQGIRSSNDHVAIEDNEYLAEDTTGPSEAVLLSGASFNKVRRNYISGEFSGAAIESDSSAAANGLLIEENNINNSDTAGLTIEISHPSTRGLVAYNTLASGDTGTGIASLVEEGASKWVENYLVNDTAETGAVVPTSASG